MILGHIWHSHGVRAPGIDRAAEAKSTGAVMVEPVDNHRWRATELDGTLSDDRLVLAAQRADVIGVDSPFGWPAAFVSAVTAHHALQPWPGPTERATLTHRETDRAVRSLAVGTPLSVSANKLGSVARRCAALFCSDGGPTKSGLAQRCATEAVRLSRRTRRSPQGVAHREQGIQEPPRS